MSDFIMRPSFPVPLIFFKEILCSLAIALTEGGANTYSLLERSSYEDTPADYGFSLVS